MTSGLAVRLGVQTPRVELRPQGTVGSRGPQAVELGARCGLLMDPAQQLTLEIGMAVRVDGSWAASDLGLIESRQNGKNATVEVREAYGLTVLDEWIIHTSHLFKTTRESYNRLLGLIEADPDVRNCLVSNVASPASGYEMRFRHGGRISFIARSRTSGRGLTGDLLIFDEAQDLDDDAQGALLPTISARPGAQVWYMGSAPDETSTVLHRVRKRGREGTDTRLAYLEFSADPDADLDDREAWAQANPALGTRITEEAVEAERRAMSDEQFARERLSISPDLPDPDESRLISKTDWVACQDEKSGPVGPVAFALDVSPDRGWASIGVAAESAKGGVHVEVADRRAGTAWLVGRAKELHSTHGMPIAVAAGSPAASLLPELEKAGVSVLVVSTAEHAQACGQVFDAIVEHRLRHLGQPELDVAVAGADRRFYGDSWLWFRRGTEVDISPLVAVTLAVWARMTMPGEQEPWAG